MFIKIIAVSLMLNHSIMNENIFYVSTPQAEQNTIGNIEIENADDAFVVTKACEKHTLHHVWVTALAFFLFGTMTGVLYERAK